MNADSRTTKAVAASCRITIWNREFDITDLNLKAMPNVLTLSKAEICQIGSVPYDRFIDRDRGNLRLLDMQSCDVLDGDVFHATPRATW